MIHLVTLVQYVFRQAGEGQFGTDESAINMVLCSRSFPQLRATFDAYMRIADSDIEDSIKSETSGALQDGFLAIGKSCLPKVSSSMEGHGGHAV